MRRVLRSWVLGSIVMLSANLFKEDNSTLKVRVSGMENRSTTETTNVWVSVFSENDFLKKPLFSKSVAVNGNDVYVSFDLPRGEYAISTYQDLNNNKKLDRHFYGKPKEPYGFSNNVTPRFGPPKYRKCKFELGAETKTIDIKLLD